MDRPKVCTFGPTLTSRFPLMMAEIKKGEEWCRNTSDLGLSKYAQIKALSPFPFWGKIRLLYALFGLFLEGSRTGRQIRESESNSDILFHPRNPWYSSCETVLLPTLSSFAATYYKGHFR